MFLTKERALLAIPLLQAVADGGTIQFRANKVWEDAVTADFTADASRYRIKPEPQVIYVNVYAGGLGGCRATEAAASILIGAGPGVTKKFIEVID